MVVVRNSGAWMDASLIVYSGASGAKEFVDVIPPAVGEASTTRTSSPSLAGYAGATRPFRPKGIRRRPPPRGRRGFDDQNVQSGLGEVRRGDQAVVARTHDNDIGFP